MYHCIHVCQTCRYSKTDKHDAQGRRGGQLLYEALLSLREQAPNSVPEIRPSHCMMACDNHCNLFFSAPGKHGYIVGRFAPDQQSAQTVLEAFDVYTQSATGKFSYSDWPRGIKGHFIARIPAVDTTTSAEDSA